MKALIFFTCLLNLSACLKVTDAQLEEIENETNLVPQVVALPEPNRYKVILPVHGDIQTIHRSLEQENESSLVAVPMKLSNSRLTDDQVEAGKTYLYSAGYQKDGEFEEVFNFKVTIPFDYLIDSKVELTKNETWNQYSRIFLTESGSLITNGYDLMVQAKEIISKGGTIQTIQVDSKAAPSQSGLSGGQISINVESATGVLKVELRGQHGGDGPKGGPLGMWPELMATISPFPSGTGHSVPSQGRKGLAGGNGGNGGHTGRFQMAIKNPTEFSVLPSFRPGLGGSGGEGGAGDQPPILGLMFTPGPSGERGANGHSGSIEMACLQTIAGRNCWLQ